MPAYVEVDLRLDPDSFADEATLLEAATRRAGMRADEVGRVEVRRRCVDARRGHVAIEARVALHPYGAAEPLAPKPVDLPTLSGEPEVVIVGAGPAGLFCAWRLAQANVRSVVLERGRKVRERRRDVARLSRTGTLDPQSNYCFGEGGAGTFSDGKLHTRSSKRGNVRAVLEAFVGYGASTDLLVDARPHIGTNRLPLVVTAMREHLEAADVVFRFDERVEGLHLVGDDVRGVKLAGGQTVEARAVVLATGHSARDVFVWLHQAGVRLSFKPFAMGVRLEHSQTLIDRVQYGRWAGHAALGPATYRLVERIDGVGVFSFCMCPGGHIVPATTEPDGIVVNGWSNSSRRGRYANSGFVAEVDAQQLGAMGFDPAHALDGIACQRHLERLAFEAGGGGFCAPAQRVDDFVAGVESRDLPSCSYPRGVTPGPLHSILGNLAQPLRSALSRIDLRMKGFVTADAIAVGVESRTSCPVRVERDRVTLQSPGRPGLFPCAEGSGHAGGIASSALDGIRVAERIISARGGWG